MLKYFKSREEAGKLLVEKLVKYRYENSIVIALSDGGVAVGEPIAKELHCLLSFLIIENINIPGEPEPYGAISQEGRLTHNSYYSQGQIDGWYSEFHGNFEQEQREKFHKMNQLLGDGGILNTQMVKDRVVILVADGLISGALLDAAMNFLKPIRTQKIIIVTPLANVGAVDRMHILADELHVLGVSDDMLDIGHYYEENNLPSHEETIKKINQIILNWQ